MFKIITEDSGPHNPIEAHLRIDLGREVFDTSSEVTEVNVIPNVFSCPAWWGIFFSTSSANEDLPAFTTPALLDRGLDLFIRKSVLVYKSGITQVIFPD